MSSYRVRVCDICGKEMSLHGMLTVKNWFHMHDYTWPNKLEICSDCKEKMFEWIKQNRQNSTAN